MPEFNAKDYNFVAKRLREEYATIVEGWVPGETPQPHREASTVCHLALAFAKKYQEDNPNFDPIKFLNQCSPDIDRFPFAELWEISEDDERVS